MNEPLIDRILAYLVIAMLIAAIITPILFAVGVLTPCGT